MTTGNSEAFTVTGGQLNLETGHDPLARALQSFVNAFEAKARSLQPLALRK